MNTTTLACRANADDSLGAILPNAFKRFWAVFKKLWLGYLAVFIPLNIIYWLLFTLLNLWIGDKLNLVQTMRIGNCLDKLLNGTVGLICIAATMLAIRDLEENRDFTLVGTFKQAILRWGVTFAAVFLVGLATGVLTCFCIVPGIIFGIYFIFAVTIAVLGDGTITGAFAASKSLVNNRWWETLGIVVILGLSTAAVSIPGGVVAIFGAIPLGVVQALEAEGESIANGVKIVLHVLEFFGTVVGGTLVDIAELLLPSGIVVLYLRRKANSRLTADNQAMAISQQTGS